MIQSNKFQSIIDTIDNTDDVGMEIESDLYELNDINNSNLENRDLVDDKLVENYSEQDSEIEEAASKQDDVHLTNSGIPIYSSPKNSVSRASPISSISSFSSESYISRLSNISHDNCRVSYKYNNITANNSPNM